MWCRCCSINKAGFLQSCPLLRHIRHGYLSPQVSASEAEKEISGRSDRMKNPGFMPIDKLLVSLPLVYGSKVQYISLHKDESMFSDSTVKYATLEASAWKNTLQHVSQEHQPPAPGWRERKVKPLSLLLHNWHAENKICLLLWLLHLANDSEAKAKRLRCYPGVKAILFLCLYIINTSNLSFILRPLLLLSPDQSLFRTFALLILSQRKRFCFLKWPHPFSLTSL